MRRQPWAARILSAARRRPDINPDFLDIARLQAPNPLLYRLFPLTCATEETLIIETPERVQLAFALASIGNRFLAVAIDHCLANTDNHARGR